MYNCSTAPIYHTAEQLNVLSTHIDGAARAPGTAVKRTRSMLSLCTAALPSAALFGRLGLTPLASVRQFWRTPIRWLW